MARGSFGARLGVRLAVVVGVGLGMMGCQALYGGKPEKLATPTKKREPKEEAVAEIPIKEIEDCQADFRGDSKRAIATAQPRLAEQLTEQGNDALAAADKTPEPLSQANRVREAVDKYRNALLKDPYNTQATLRLALAYDRLYRKGCAIALLKRLATLSAHPDFASRANSAIDSISDNASWFKRYRKDAMSAAGR